MRLDKCDAYTAKETLRYMGRKTYMAAARRPTKKGKSERDKRRNKSTSK